VLLVFQGGYAPSQGTELNLFDLPGAPPSALPIIRIQNLAPGFDYLLATNGGKLTLAANNDAVYVAPELTMRLDAIRVVNGLAELTIQGNMDFGTVDVQTSSDLQSWSVIGNAPIIHGQGRFVHFDSPTPSQRFYRVAMKP